MRIAFAIVLAAMISIGAFAQHITVVKQGAKLQTIFKEIRQQSNYDFLYNEEIMKDMGPIDIHVRNASVEQALDSLFLKLPLKYEIQDRVVMVSTKDTVPQQQKYYAITGIVKDKKGEVIPGASVYLSNYKIGTSADRNGRFMLKDLSPGNYNVLVQMIGFLPMNQNTVIINRSAEMVIVLEETVNLLNEVVVKPDRYRPFRIKIFEESFIGTSRNAKQCQILNPDVIQFDYDTVNHVIRARADEFIIIENKALGYRIKYLLRYFEKNEKTNFVYFYGYPYFEELEERTSKRKRYTKRRQLAYRGSPEHFFCALYNNTTDEAGFIINQLVKTPNYKRPSNEIIDAKIRFYSDNIEAKPKIKKRKEHLKYWKDVKQLPDTVEVLVRAEIPRDSLVHQNEKPLKTLSFENALYIIYKGERETSDYLKHPEYEIKRPGDLASYQISLVYKLTNSVGFYENGGIYDPGSLLYEGVWAYKKVADMLPMDYSLPDKKGNKKK